MSAPFQRRIQRHIDGTEEELIETVTFARPRAVTGAATRARPENSPGSESWAAKTTNVSGTSNNPPGAQAGSSSREAQQNDQNLPAQGHYRGQGQNEEGNNQDQTEINVAESQPDGLPGPSGAQQSDRGQTSNPSGGTSRGGATDDPQGDGEPVRFVPLNICFQATSVPELVGSVHAFKTIPHFCDGATSELRLTSDAIPFLFNERILAHCVRPEMISWNSLRGMIPQEVRILTLSDLLVLLETNPRAGRLVLLDIQSNHQPQVVFEAIRRVMAQEQHSNTDWRRRIIICIPEKRSVPHCQAILRGFEIVLKCRYVGQANKIATSDNNYEVNFMVDVSILMSPQGIQLLGNTAIWQRKVYAARVKSDEEMKWCLRQEVWGVITQNPTHFQGLREAWQNTHPSWWREKPLGLRDWLRASAAESSARVFPARRHLFHEGAATPTQNPPPNDPDLLKDTRRVDFAETIVT